MSLVDCRDRILELKEKLSQIVIGQNKLIEGLLTGLLIDKHILILGRPGLGKTLLVSTLARLIDADFSRIQFTPDLMPSDILGVELPVPGEEAKFEFEPGPIFGNLVLADEINRANPRTQAALVQALQEREVTIRGVTYLLPSGEEKSGEKDQDTLFCVMATQNPYEMEGVYPLPENVIDRFSMNLKVSYPGKDYEFRIATTNFERKSKKLNPITKVEEILRIRKEIEEKVYIEKNLIIDYVLKLVLATREIGEYPEDLDSTLQEIMKEHSEQIGVGASPRATQCLAKASKVRAFFQGRDYVLPEDVKYVGRDVLRHRLILKKQASVQDVSSEDIIEDVFSKVPVP